MNARVHGCGELMHASVFSPNDRTVSYRGQPIWLCLPCSAWEPREGWQGPFPLCWDGTYWTNAGRHDDMIRTLIREHPFWSYDQVADRMRERGLSVSAMDVVRVYEQEAR